MPTVDSSDPEYNICAMEDLHKVYAKAIALSASLREEAPNDDGSLRESYNGSWMSDMQQWKSKWPHASEYCSDTFFCVRGRRR